MSEQRLSVTFGAFSCDVIGYDDPFSILNHVVSLFGEVAKANPSFGAGQVKMSDLERAQVAAGLASHASQIEEMADQSATGGLRYVVTNDDAIGNADTQAAEDDAAVEDAAEDAAAEDQVIISAEEDDTATGGVLELRDTLEAAEPAFQMDDDETVALEIEPDAIEPAAEIIEDQAEPVSAEPPQQTVSDEPDTVRVEQMAEEISAGSDEAPKPAPEEAPIDISEAVANVTAPEPAPDLQESVVQPRRPLRLNVPAESQPDETVSEKAAPPAPQAAAADKPERKPRVTVTKLPLRPERPKTERKQTLTQVHKVEPVVTLNATIADSAVEAAKPSRAERVKTKMDQRNSEDDGDNFLFADVDEAIRKAGIEETAQQEDQKPRSIDPAPESGQPAETDRKPRRSFANLLGFKKSAKIAPEATAEDDATSEPATSIHTAGVDGFDRLRESVAAAMPATDDQVVQYSQTRRPPESISEAIDYDDESSPTHFARRVGATTLQDLLEASAVYMDLVEGKSRFSRRDVMQALNQIGADKDYSQEARLKSFRKLLTSGSLVKVDDGMFTVSQATRFGYETQLQA